jgi:23S rRNA G2069 N7-methylase RlmK/C1962 C5-methylase RlmI
MISKQSLKKAWETTKRGYGQGVRAVQEYAPKIERRLGRMAQTTTDAFKIKQMDVRPDFRVPRNDVQFGRPQVRRSKRHDFGKLSFDLS